MEHGQVETIMAFSALGIGLWLAISQPDKWKALIRIMNARWLMSIFAVICFCIWVTVAQSGNTEMRTSVKRGIIALIIAIMGEIGLTVAPFWTVVAVSYFMERWV